MKNDKSITAKGVTTLASDVSEMTTITGHNRDMLAKVLWRIANQLAYYEGKKR